MNQTKIGKFISQCRKERGFLQKDIAARLGVSEKTVSKWECGNGLPEVVFMEPLCQILGITVNELLAGESIPILEMMRSIDRSRLELVKQLEFEQLRMRRSGCRRNRQFCERKYINRYGKRKTFLWVSGKNFLCTENRNT